MCKPRICGSWSAGALLLLCAIPMGWAQAQSSGSGGGFGSSSGSAASGNTPASSSSSSGTAGMQSTAAPAAPGQNAYQGSVVTEKATADVRSLSITDAIDLGLRNNLGLILSGQNVQQAGGQKLQQLQQLLPTVTGNLRESLQQTNLRAQGLSFPGFPAIIGPFGYTDVRANLNWTLLNITSLQNYLAAKHNFEGARLSLQDARDLVVLTVGNAYLRCVADQASIENDQAQVASSKVSLDQAVANHQAGTSPQIDELRARVDYQTQQQYLISDQNAYEKDKLALARAIGLPLEQKFVLTDRVPYAPLDAMDPQTALQTAYSTRKDLQALEQQVQGAQASHKGARAERLPTLAFEGDYGDIGPTLGHSHGTFDAVGTASVPIFEEAKLRGDERLAKAQVEQYQARLSDLRGQIDADVHDSMLDLESAQKLVEVARSNVQLANQSLSDAQQRFAAGVADNLPVTQAQAAVAQANSQYVASLYQHNLAKLELARALGVVEVKVKAYLGGR